MSEKLPKQKSHAFRKDIYLLGADEHGVKYWLEAASWDCSWYWGFGYVETYTNNHNPSIARDISSHEHFKGKWLTESERGYLHRLSDLPGFTSTLTEREEWQLSELMQTIYTLKQSAEVFGHGGSHLTSIEEEREVVTRPEYVEEINKVILPKLFEQVYALLDPDA